MHLELAYAAWRRNWGIPIKQELTEENATEIGYPLADLEKHRKIAVLILEAEANYRGDYQV